MPPVTSPTTRFTFTEYMKMVRAGVFGSARVELINGRIYRVAPQLNPHMAAISKAVRALHRVVPDSEWLIVQGTMRIDVRSALDPDLLWLAAPIDTPAKRWPSPLLLIEVSHTTYRRDSGVKLRKYAEAGVRDYWIVNIPANRVELYREPQNPTPAKRSGWRYGSVQTFARGQSVALLQRPEVALAVEDLLP